MHINQQKILDLAKSTPIANWTLRQIGEKVDITNPQTVKFHLQKLIDKGFLSTDYKPITSVESSLVAIPIYGSANCGPASFIAEDNIQGYIKVSPGIVNSIQNPMALKAIGNSMNMAKINGQFSIQDGDYVIIDRSRIPNNNDYAVVVYEGLANIKRMRINNEEGTVALVSESTEEYPPILLTITDFDNGLVNIAGTVERVVSNSD